jgi:hypothetical protein
MYFTKLGELLSITTLLMPVAPDHVDIAEYLTPEEIGAVHSIQEDYLERGISTHLLLSEQFERSSCSVYVEMPEIIPQSHGVMTSAFTVGVDDNFDGVLEKEITDEVCVSVSGRIVRATIKSDTPFEFPFP